MRSVGRLKLAGRGGEGFLSFECTAQGRHCLRTACPCSLDTEERGCERSDHAGNCTDYCHDICRLHCLWSKCGQGDNQNEERDEQCADYKPEPVRYPQCLQVFFFFCLRLIAPPLPYKQRAEKTNSKDDEQCDRNVFIQRGWPGSDRLGTLLDRLA